MGCTILDFGDTRDTHFGGWGCVSTHCLQRLGFAVSSQPDAASTARGRCSRVGRGDATWRSPKAQGTKTAATRNRWMRRAGWPMAAWWQALARAILMQKQRAKKKRNASLGPQRSAGQRATAVGHWQTGAGPSVKRPPPSVEFNESCRQQSRAVLSEKQKKKKRNLSLLKHSPGAKDTLRALPGRAARPLQRKGRRPGAWRGPQPSLEHPPATCAPAPSPLS